MNKAEREKVRKTQLTGKAMHLGDNANKQRNEIHHWQKHHRDIQNYYTRKSNAKRFINQDATMHDCLQMAEWTHKRIQGIKSGTIDMNKPWM